jgi:hypothetical protein
MGVGEMLARGRMELFGWREKVTVMKTEILYG